jgi:hypothetical protein
MTSKKTHEETAAIPVDSLKRVFTSLEQGVKLCIGAEGDHFSALRDGTQFHKDVPITFDHHRCINISARSLCFEMDLKESRSKDMNWIRTGCVGDQ